MPVALLAIAPASASASASGTGPMVARMRDHRRVLVIAAPAAADPGLREQRRLLAGWEHDAAERDVTVVEVVGAVVSGAADDAASLRTVYRLAAGRFAVLLVGKDGHVAYRSAMPVSAERLRGTIDAMPMRRAGLR